MARTPLYEMSSQERREFPRYAAAPDFVCPVLIGTQRQYCRLSDISLGGACLTFKLAPVPAESRVTFDLPEDGRFTAETCWQSGRNIGVKFDFSEQALAFVSEHVQAA